ncbi:alcohol dehydrogenase -like domain-containing protein [Zalerion maritima]|uniref:L-arabinitol 4-dehydrogenase n=1 Tax=Zalerion maritima TaxID=339359 RepID=A0AAD5WSH5_9PEZI|nr:alcohol dehydrogenase -like domain-containing protein [Zalerion maritima]
MPSQIQEEKPQSVSEKANIAPAYPPESPHSPSITKAQVSAAVCQPVTSTNTISYTHDNSKSPIPLPLTAEVASPLAKHHHTCSSCSSAGSCASNDNSSPLAPLPHPLVSKQVDIAPFPASLGYTTVTVPNVRYENVTVLVPPKDSPKPQNLSFVLNKPLDVGFVERPIPKLQSPHDVLVAVQYTGICGSDVHYWEHGRIGHFVVESPMVLGHESAGTVVAVGSAVKTLVPGDRIALEPGYPCRRCGDCLAGRYNLCHEMVFAATPPYDGTLTGFWVAPFDFCYKLPGNVSLQEGALVEPLAVAVHIVRQARVSPGQSVVIMGAGPVGLLCAAVAKSFGATTVVCVDIIAAKLEFAKEFAATHTYLSQRVSAEQNATALKEAAGLGGGADAVIDASGAEPSIQTSLYTVRVGGTYVQAGMGKPDINFPIMAMCLKEVTARGSFRYGPGDYKLAIELVASKKVDVKALVNGVVEFKHAEEAFKKVKEGQVIKILIAGPNEKLETHGELDTGVDAGKLKEAEAAAANSEGGCC